MANLSVIAKELGEALKSRGYMLAIAESCTGGMVAQAITSVAGSSAWFDRGFVTYSNAAKIEMLSVRTETIEKFGAASEETAKEMATGALKHSRSQIAASITGIAGPDGGSQDKPVGTVCFGFAQTNQCTACTQHFTGSRQQVRRQATVFLMQQLIQQLNQP